MKRNFLILAGGAIISLILGRLGILVKPMFCIFLSCITIICILFVIIITIYAIDYIKNFKLFKL